MNKKSILKIHVPILAKMVAYMKLIFIDSLYENNVFMQFTLY